MERGGMMFRIIREGCGPFQSELETDIEPGLAEYSEERAFADGDLIGIDRWAKQIAGSL
jgi:hypothetical protein